MENEAEIFVGDIKEEPERHYVAIIPESFEKRYQLRKLNINIRKFDVKLRRKAEMFETFLHCEKCDFVTRESCNLTRHLPVCGANTDPTKNKRIYACAFCKLKFPNFNSRRKHASDYHRCGSQWQCSNCTCSFTRIKQMRNHYSTCVKKFLCETCEDKFQSQSSLKDHQMLHRHGIYATKPIIRINCDMCDCWFRTESSLYHHRRHVHNRIRCQCDICEKTFSNKRIIRQHMQIHYKVPCPICPHLLAQRRLNEHIEQQHSSTAQYECEVCDKIFRTRSGLNNHRHQVHEVQEVQCDFCGKTSNNKNKLSYYLRFHVKIHCPTCRQMVAKHQLKYHMELKHSTPVKCNDCGKSFFSKRSLSRHNSYMHGVVAEVQCGYCNKTLANKNDLRRHLQLHLKVPCSILEDPLLSPKSNSI